VTWLPARLIVLLLVVAWGVCGAAEQSVLQQLEYENDRLTIHAHAVPLGDLMNEIGRKSGAEVHGACEARNISAEFDAEPLADALERLLGQRNSFALRYGHDGELRVIELLPQPTTAPVFSVGITRADEALPPPVRDPGFPGLTPSFPGLTPSFRGLGAAAAVVQDHTGGVTPVGRGQRHQKTSGGARMPEVLGALQAAMANPQPGADQPQTADDLQQRMRRVFLNSLRGMDDVSLAAYMTTPEGQRAATLLQYYAAHHIGSTSQQKADGILSRLPVPPTAIKH
jgi:hypothetical protein